MAKIFLPRTQLICGIGCILMAGTFLVVLFSGSEVVKQAVEQSDRCQALREKCAADDIRCFAKLHAMFANLLDEQSDGDPVAATLQALEQGLTCRRLEHQCEAAHSQCQAALVEMVARLEANGECRTTPASSATTVCVVAAWYRKVPLEMAAKPLIGSGGETEKQGTQIPNPIEVQPQTQPNLAHRMKN